MLLRRQCSRWIILSYDTNNSHLHFTENTQLWQTEDCKSQDKVARRQLHGELENDVYLHVLRNNNTNAYRQKQFCEQQNLI